MSDTITVPARFNGPPGSANGGVACGLIASHMTAREPEVTLRAPPPLDTPLAVRSSNGSIFVHDGDTLVAEARGGVFDLAIPDPPTVEQARAAMARFPGAEHHFFPTCFVCGTDRAPGDGLRIFPGWVEERDDLAAAIWEPAPTHCHDGVATDAAVWGALDCPSAWTWRGDVGAPIVLGRLTVRRDAPIVCGESIIVATWPVSLEGRKFTGGTALFGADGTVRAASKAIWIRLAA